MQARSDGRSKNRAPQPWPAGPERARNEKNDGNKNPKNRHFVPIVPCRKIVPNVPGANIQRSLLHRLELAVVELGVKAVSGQKLVVGALLDDLAVLHHQDDVRLADGGQPVGHDEAGAALHHLGEGFLDAHFGAGVDRAGGLVQNQHGGQAEHHPRDAQKLLLALADVAAVLGQDGVVAGGQPLDEAVGVSGFGRRHDLLAGGVGAAVGDVLPHGAGPQPGVLQHHAVAAPQRGAGGLADVGAGHPDAAAVHVIKAHQQVDEGGLAAAGGAHDGHTLAGLDVQAEVLDQGPVGQVAEADVLQRYPAVRLQNGRAGRFGGLVPGVQQGEHPRRAGQSVLQLGHDARYLVERLGVLVGVAQKDAQLADGDAPGRRVERAHQPHAGVDDVVHKAGGGVGQAGKEGGFQAHVRQPLVHLVEGGQALGLVAEGLHHLLSLDHLVDEGGLLAPHRALAVEVAVGVVGDEARHHQAERGDEDHHQRDEHVLPEHEQQGAHNGQHAGEQLGEAHQQPVREGVHVGHHPADDVPGGVAVQVGKGQGLDLVDGVVAQVPRDREGDLVVAHAEHPLGQRGQGHHHQDAGDDAGYPALVHLAGAEHQVDGVAAQQGDIQLGRHAAGRHQQAGRHIKAVRPDISQHPAQGRAALGGGEGLFLVRSAHAGAPPFTSSEGFLNWLS